MAREPRPTSRAALAGATAAAAWAAQQPLDIRVFGVPYDDTELLGKFVTRSRAWRPIGIALHLGNGAAVGAIYARAATLIPGPRWARGALLGLAEHLVTWPGTQVLGAIHPAAGELPRLWGDHRAFAQATWRHLLFGLVLEAVLSATDRHRRPAAATPDPR